MFTRLLNELRVVRDGYKTTIDTILKEKKEKLEVIKSDYRPGSATAKTALEKIEDEFNAKIEKIRNEAEEYITVFFDNVIDYETNSVQKIDTVSIRSVEAIAGLPITASELKVVNAWLGKNKNYWVEKMLLDIAHKNAISDTELGLESDYETKMKIVSDLQVEFIKMIAEYDGDPTVNNMMFLHDSKLSKAEVRYKNGLHNIDMSSDNVALHAYTTLCNSTNLLQKATIATNVLTSDVDESIKNEFMYLIACSGKDDFVSSMGGVKKTYTEFKEKEFQEYENAKNAMNKIKQGENVSVAVDGIIDNKFINGMLMDAKQDYASIREYLNVED